MSSLLAPSIFDSFNARSLEPSQVASTFVPSQAYFNLLKRRHTIVVGPRGSGKTTLLKMLQQPALEEWQRPEAKTARETIDFTGVFIPTDISWSEQMKGLSATLDQEAGQQLSIATFTTHILRSLVIAMLSRTTKELTKHTVEFRRVDLPPRRESELCKMLCAAWHLNKTVPSLLGIKQALSARLGEIRETASIEAMLGSSDRPQRLAKIRFLHMHFVQAAGVGAELFDDSIRDKNGKWALLFDELELAPKWIQDQLLLSLRSADPRFLFKLAMSPYSESRFFMQDRFGAAYKQDFDYIPLWYAEKRVAYPFCEQLWYSMLQKKEKPRRDPKEVLGRSYFETPYSEWKSTGTAYGPSSRIGRLFISLDKTDPTFHQYLKLHSIDPLQLHKLSSIERASHIRKVSPLVIVRQFFRGPDEEESTKGRSRKNRVLYAGAEALFAASEGNPRWLIGILDRLLDQWPGTDQGISATAQAAALSGATQAFRALLRTIPAKTHDSPFDGVLEMIGTIAKRFHHAVVDEPFSDDPPLTILIDQRAPTSVLDLVTAALNAGALVYVSDDESALVLTSAEALRGKRFRISYLLAPEYKLPIRLGRAVALTSILAPRGYPSGQEELF